MLQIKNLNIFLKSDLRVIIDNFNFSLSVGDKVALIGEEGNGKSVLLKAIADPKSIADSFDIKGEIIINNEIIGYLPQMLEPNLLALNCKVYLDQKLGSKFYDYNQYYKLLMKFNLLDNILERTLYQLSGGEKIKFLLLIEMLKNPTILLLDEPSNDLDLNSLKFLKNFIIQSNIPIIFVSHDRTLLSETANKIIHLEAILRRTKPKHTIVGCGYDDYVNNRNEFIYNTTQKAKKEKAEFIKKETRYQRIYSSVAHALQNTKNDVEGRLLKKKMHAVKAKGKQLEKEKANLLQAPDYEEAINIFFDEDIFVPNGKEIIDFYLDELSIGEYVLAREIHLKIVGPEKICIIGDNGVGKTTLLKQLLCKLRELNLKVGYMPQNYLDDIAYNLTPIEYLASDYTALEHTKISTYLGSLSFTRDEMSRPIVQLSGGQKAKLYFAKMNLNKCQVLVLDEPTRNLSPLSQQEVLQALKDYKGAIISVSHDQDYIAYVCQKVYELSYNGLLFSDKIKIYEH